MPSYLQCMCDVFRRPTDRSVSVKCELWNKRKAYNVSEATGVAGPPLDRNVMLSSSPTESSCLTFLRQTLYGHTYPGFTAEPSLTSAKLSRPKAIPWKPSRCTSMRNGDLKRRLLNAQVARIHRRAIDCNHDTRGFVSCTQGSGY